MRQKYKTKISFVRLAICGLIVHSGFTAADEIGSSTGREPASSTKPQPADGVINTGGGLK